MFRGLSSFAPLFVLLALSACAALPMSPAAPSKLRPGDHVGDMVLQKGSPMGQFIGQLSGCRFPNPVAPGSYTGAECSMRLVGDELRLDLAGWTTTTQERLENNWPAITYDLYVDDKAVDVTAFGTYDQQNILLGTPSSVSRNFDVALVHPTPGKHTLRIVMHVDHTINDGWSNYPPGSYESIIPFDFLACC